MIAQICIALLGVTAIWLSQDANPARRRFACLFGLAGQPFWFGSAISAEQWGIFVLCCFYTGGMGPRRQVELAERRGVVVIRLRAAWRRLCLAADILVPRFLTEDVALQFVGGDRTDLGSYEIVCCMNDVQPGEAFDAVATVDSFGWLGFGVTYRVGECRPWPTT